ncbi:MAG: hypothetical protein CMP23_08475 [Rickettsiales bacterium]|nr:hypothetical protein [Rickettsiales bacterium]
MLSKRNLVVFLLSLAVAGGASYGSYQYGKRVGQSEGYEWGQRKGRLDAARERPPQPVDRGHTAEQLRASGALDGLGLEEAELPAFVDLLNRAPSPCRGGARKGVSLATALVDAERACPAYATAQLRLARAALRSFSDLEESLAVLRVERRADLDVAGRSVRGDPEAPVTLVEWADFQCPYCVRSRQLIDALLERSEVKVVFKHFPLSFHPAALPAALAMEAAGLQDRAWEMHDLLFDLGKGIGDGLDPDEQIPEQGPVPFEEQAQELSLDLERYRADFRSAEVRAIVEADRTEALSVGVKGTPSLFIDGRRVVERPTVENLVRLVEKAAAERAGRFSWDLAPSPAP